MLDIKIFDKFIKEANVAHMLFCVWLATNNRFAEHQVRWTEGKRFGKYKNFWTTVVPALRHEWVLSTARFFDPAYPLWDKKKKKPRICLDYILINLDDKILSDDIRKQLKSHSPIIDCLKEHRDNIHAHNAANFNITRIEAGVDKLFQWLEDAIARIKKEKPHLNKCGNINIEYTWTLSQDGVNKIFKTLLLGEKYEK